MKQSRRFGAYAVAVGIGFVAATGFAIGCSSPAAPTATVAPTWTPEPTWTPTAEPTWTPAPTWTPVPTYTPTPAPTWTPVPTATATATAVPTPTPTATAIPTHTPTATPSPVPTPTPTQTPLPTATPTNTPTPIPSPTLMPTPGPSRGGVSGVLVHNPQDGRIDCSTKRGAQSVISDSTIDSAAFLRFAVPDVNEWSVGFVYHQTANGDELSAVTFIYGDGPWDVRARHWVRDGKKQHHAPPSEPIRRGTLKTGPGELNELVFRTSSNGSFLRLNDEIAIEVPASQLVRESGLSRVCVGFRGEETERYLIRYEDLRTRFTREGESWRVRVAESDLDDGKVECPDDRQEDGYIAEVATDSWILMDVKSYSVADWSVGVVYHGVDRRNSRSTIRRDDMSYYAKHSTYDRGNFDSLPRKQLSPSRFNVGLFPGDIVEFETTVNGSWLRLNGRKILEVAGSQLTRRVGSVKVCANLFSGERAAYEIAFSNLWAWTD